MHSIYTLPQSHSCWFWTLGAPGLQFFANYQNGKRREAFRCCNGSEVLLESVKGKPHCGRKQQVGCVLNLCILTVNDRFQSDSVEKLKLCQT